MLKTDVIKAGLESAIRNCNRNIYEWVEGKKKSSHFTISYTEIRGLVKNWMIRKLRDSMGLINVERALKEGNLSIHVNEVENYIAGLDLTSDGQWRKTMDDISLLKSIMKNINYKALTYNPSDYLMDGVTPKNENFDHPEFIDLSSIKNIKF